MALQLTNLRVVPEGQTGKQSVFMPTNMQPLVRSLVSDRPAASELFDPGWSPSSPVAPVAVNASGVTYTVEVPFRGGQANTIALPFGSTVWLDDPSQNRKFKGRRAVTMINEDAVIGLRFAFGNGVADGALIAPGGNISFPLDERSSLFAFTLNPAGGNLSLIQYA